MIEHVCIICGNKSNKGLTIQGKFICQLCESDIVGMTVDNPSYDFIKQRLKQIWKDEVVSTV